MRQPCLTYDSPLRCRPYPEYLLDLQLLTWLGNLKMQTTITINQTWGGGTSTSIPIQSKVLTM